MFHFESDGDSLPGCPDFLEQELCMNLQSCLNWNGSPLPVVLDGEVAAGNAAAFAFLVSAISTSLLGGVVLSYGCGCMAEATVSTELFYFSGSYWSVAGPEIKMVGLNYYFDPEPSESYFYRAGGYDCC